MANERKKPAKKNTRSRSTPRRTSTRKKTTHKKPADTARRKGRRKTNGQSLFANRWVQAALALVIVGALAATVLALGNRHQRVTYDFGTDAPFVEGVDISEHNGTVDWTNLNITVYRMVIGIVGSMVFFLSAPWVYGKIEHRRLTPTLNNLGKCT